MELEDLKNSWKNIPETTNSKNTIMELMTHKSYGPIATLKETLTKQVIAIPILYAVLTWKLLEKPELGSDPFFGLFCGLAIALTIAFLIAYRIVRNMAASGSPVSRNVNKQIISLKKVLFSYRVLAFTAVILLAIFLELFKNKGMALGMQGWFQLSFALRISIYLAALPLLFFVAKSAFDKQFGRHLNNLQSLVKQLEK
jgi:hypothetical protein